MLAIFCGWFYIMFTWSCYDQTDSTCKPHSHTGKFKQLNWSSNGIASNIVSQLFLFKSHCYNMGHWKQTHWVLSAHILLFLFLSNSIFLAVWLTLIMYSTSAHMYQGTFRFQYCSRSSAKIESIQCSFLSCTQLSVDFFISWCRV